MLIAIFNHIIIIISFLFEKSQKTKELRELRFKEKEYTELILTQQEAYEKAKAEIRSRDEFLSSNKNFGKFIVHGHTPVSKPDVRPNRINIDTGVYATGILTLLTIQGDQLFTI